MPNNGQFKFFRKEEAAAKPVLHLRITGQRGRYGWDFPPTDRAYIASAAPHPGERLPVTAQAPAPNRPSRWEKTPHRVMTRRAVTAESRMTSRRRPAGQRAAKTSIRTR